MEHASGGSWLSPQAEVALAAPFPADAPLRKPSRGCSVMWSTQL